ncbi:MAG: helix-turn-helix transcriptional regulator [Actinobacteria bacterium]|nr:helix-turn-helix transcriptional regulator [Actinomycetota bacterium]
MSIATPAATITHTAALARFGHALSDTTRVGILQLACLRGCGLVEAIPDGRRTWYRLADGHIAPALDELLRVVLYIEPGCCEGAECNCA